MAFVISGILVSLGFVAMGMLIAFWPETYLRWAQRSAEDYAPWLLRGWNNPQRRLQFTIFGVSSILFGVVFVILVVWIHWFQ